MPHQRIRFPYEWQIALSGAVLLGLSALLPSAPFAGALALWARWIGEPLLQWRIPGAYNEAVSSFLPMIAALALGYALLAAVAAFEGARPRALRLARVGAGLMCLLGILVTLDAVTTIGQPLDIVHVAVSCTAGLVFAALAVSLRGTDTHACTARLVIVSLAISGISSASFVLLPLGLLALLVTTVGLAVMLVRKDAHCGTA